MSIPAFATPVSIECSKDPLFTANACDVCYTEQFESTKTPTGWAADISTVKIPWEQDSKDLQELITESAQVSPEIIVSSGVVVTPDSPDKIWDFDTDILWYKAGDTDHEFIIDAGDKLSLYTLKSGVKLNLVGQWVKDTLLIKAPLIYAEFESDLYQTSVDKTRNICILSTFMSDTGTPTAPPTTQAPLVPIVIIPAPTDNTTDTPALDAAGPEDAVTPEITPDQTKTQAGPEIWIFLLLAFVFSSAWTAYKRQKI